jgi:hypothetical protein
MTPRLFVCASSLAREGELPRGVAEIEREMQRGSRPTGRRGRHTLLLVVRPRERLQWRPVRRAANAYIGSDGQTVRSSVL